MPIKPLSIYTLYHTSEYFSLRIKRSKVDTKIIMGLQHGIVSTSDLPDTFPLLKQYLPTVFKSTCYNEYNYPFYKEVLRTEVGHLFEHILIEYMCLLKVSSGIDDVEYSGVTKWNWLQYPKGSFHITVSAGINDTAVLANAMSKSINLLNIIITSTGQIKTPADLLTVDYAEKGPPETTLSTRSLLS